MYVRDQHKRSIPPTVTVGRTKFYIHINTEAGPKARLTADRSPRRTSDAKVIGNAEERGRIAAASAGANAARIEMVQKLNVAARRAR